MVNSLALEQFVEFALLNSVLAVQETLAAAEAVLQLLTAALVAAALEEQQL
jgi:hypothetical protein